MGPKCNNRPSMVSLNYCTFTYPMDGSEFYFRSILSIRSDFESDLT